jgi:mono/diheme cytochrome c family protein
MLRAVAAGAIGAILVIAITLVAGCGVFLGPAICGPWRGPLAQQTPVTVKSAARHEYLRRSGVPLPYRGKSNPFQPSIPLVLAGADLYDLRCAICHGPMGLGNGMAWRKLRQPPADLAGSISSPDIRDDFLFWTISEGGARFGSDMPSFKHDLKDTEIWAIIGYMRAAFEDREASSQPQINRR